MKKHAKKPVLYSKASEHGACPTCGKCKCCEAKKKVVYVPYMPMPYTIIPVVYTPPVIWQLPYYKWDWTCYPTLTSGQTTISDNKLAEAYSAGTYVSDQNTQGYNT